MKTPSENKEALDILSTSYQLFSKTDHTRTFMKMAREILSDQMSARGVYQAHKMDFYKYMEGPCVSIDHDKNAVALYGYEKVMTFLEALDAVIKDDAEMLAELELMRNGAKQPKPKTQEQKVEEAVDAVAEEVQKQAEEAVEELKKEIETELVNNGVIEPEQAKTAEELTAPQTTVPQQDVNKVATPNYGLGFNLDAVIHNSSVEFLMSDKAGILKSIEDKVRGQLLQNTVVILPDAKRTTTVVKGKLHKDFKEVLEIVTIESQAFLGGPAGTGKTTLAAQVAEALQLPFAHISCTAGMSEAHLLGRMIADGSYISSKFVELYENGGVFLADEVDAADANTLLILNSALANGYVSVPNRATNPTAKRHVDFKMICAANTFGNGSNEYAGREIMDAAFMDRFAAAKIKIGYDEQLERDILKDHPQEARAIHEIRKNVEKYKMRRVVSTRVFASMLKSINAGRSKVQFFERFFTGWSDEEIKKAIE